MLLPGLFIKTLHRFSRFIVPTAFTSSQLTITDPEMEFLAISLTKDSSLVFYRLFHNPFCWQIWLTHIIFWDSSFIPQQLKGRRCEKARDSRRAPRWGKTRCTGATWEAGPVAVPPAADATFRMVGWPMLHGGYLPRIMPNGLIFILTRLHDWYLSQIK